MPGRDSLDDEPYVELLGENRPIKPVKQVLLGLVLYAGKNRDTTKTWLNNESDEPSSDIQISSIFLDDAACLAGCNA